MGGYTARLATQGLCCVLLSNTLQMLTELRLNGMYSFSRDLVFKSHMCQLLNTLGLKLRGLHVNIPQFRAALYFIFICLFLNVTVYDVV